MICIWANLGSILNPIPALPDTQTEGPAGGDRLQFLRGNYSPHKGAVLQGKLQALPVHFPTLPYFTKQPCLIKMLRDAAGSGLRHPGSLSLW